MTSIVPSARDNIPTSQADRAGSPSAAAATNQTITSGTTVNGTSARNFSSPLVPNFTTAPNGKDASQYAHLNNPESNMAAPPIANSNSTANSISSSLDHVKKPSVTISANGSSGYLPNGTPVTATGSRPNIVFGSTNAAGSSPSIANSVPVPSQSTLPPPNLDPRITTPGKSPSPIPTPAASGGRPPSNFQAPGNGPMFGSMGGPEYGPNRHMHGTPVSNMPDAAMRRQSSQSTHGDMSNGGMSYGHNSSRGGMMPGAGRGRMPSFGQQYPQQPPYSSPSQGFRQMAHQRPGPNMPPHFQNQMPPGSPHLANRTPGATPSHPGTPQMQPMQLNPNQMQFQPGYNAYAQHLSPQPGHFNVQPAYDPNYGYYQNPYQMHPSYLQQQMPQGSPSARNFRPGPPQQPPYMPGQYNQTPPPSMSRSASQNPEHRPSSTSAAPGQHHAPSPTPINNQPPPLPPTQASPAGPPASSNFVRPQRTSKAISIKRPDGEVVNLDNIKSPAPATTPATAAPVPSPSPVAATVAPPPPIEAKPTKTAEEIKAEFLEKVSGVSHEDKPKADEEVKSSAADESQPTKTADVVEVQAAEQKAEIGSKEEVEKAESLSAPEEDKPVATAADDKAATTALPIVAESIKPVSADKVEGSSAETEQANADEVVARPEASSQTESTPVEDEAEKARKQKELEDEEFERMVAEMEANEKAEEEREKAFAAKRQKEKQEQEEREKKAGANSEEELKRAEREAEAAEEAREKKRRGEDESDEAKREREELFASLAKSDIGPNTDADVEGASDDADTARASATATPDIPETPEPSAGLEDSRHATATEKPAAGKHKPVPLKIDTNKPVEPAQPTPGMQSLKSARMLQLQSEIVQYPEGIKSPNPALIQDGKRAGRLYDKDFLLQFQAAFKEKPSVDWDVKLKESVGDGSESAKTARTPQTGHPGRAASNRPPPMPQAYPAMGSFGSGGTRTLPPNTTSAERFAASSRGGPTMSNPLANMAARPGAFPMGSMPMPVRAQSMNMPPQRSGTSNRGGNQRNMSRTDTKPSRKEEQKQNATMPLTAGIEVKSLEPTGQGWKPTSIGRPAAAAAVDLSGHMAPDMVQKKVKGALNRMTPENFDKISGQILTIAAQSKNEADGRTLRQVIQLTFDKACDEAHWASMYAKFCLRMLEEMSPEIKDETILDKAGNPVVGGPLFRKYLLNRCQEEFERGWTVDLPENKEGQSLEAVMLSDEYYIAAAAKRKGLGLVQFIGELYKLRMLSIKIMHQCFRRLLDFEGLPDESAIESLVKLIRTVGSTMQEELNGPQLLDQYFQRIDTIMKMEALPSRMHFMLLDTVDLRRGGWKSKDDAKGPKTLQEIHDAAAAEQAKAELQRQQQSQRGGGGGRPPAGRGDARGFSGNMPPPDYPRNQVATEDLRRLGNRRQASSQAPARTLGPSSMFSSRSNSGRPSVLSTSGTPAGGKTDTGMSSRTASRTAEPETPRTPTNAFSALADLDANEGGNEATPAVSPQPKHAVPAAATTTASGETPAADTTSASAPSDADNNSAA